MATDRQTDKMITIYNPTAHALMVNNASLHNGDRAHLTREQTGL